LKLTTACVVFGLSACSGATEVATPASDDRQPTAEFLALDREQQNLAVYDAFWHQLLTHYYDPELFATDEWRARRTQARADAARAQTRAELYYSSFPRLLRSFPESHVEVHAPEGGSNRDAPPKSPPVDGETLKRLSSLLFIHGPGFLPADILRGGTRRNLVAEVWPHSPAAEAGVPPGARLLRSQGNVDAAAKAVHYEVDFVPLDAAAARAWERGEQAETPPAPGSIVHARYDLRPFAYRKPVEVRRLEGDIQYLRFNAFGDDEAMKPVYAAIDDAPVAGLIIDLRWNSGGFQEQLQKFAGALLGTGVPLAEIRIRGDPGRLVTSAYKKTYAGPVVVLAGPASTSAAEVFAAAVQDLGRGKVIGRSTAGAVLGAQAFPLPDGGVVTLPVINLWRASGKRIEGSGVEPDVWMLPTIEDLRAGHDPVLARALLELTASSPARH
jgi:carboxyl-terminal processing protease